MNEINEKSEVRDAEIVKKDSCGMADYNKSLPALVGEIDNQVGLFQSSTGLKCPNVLVLNEKHYRMLQLGLEELFHKETVMDVQSTENKMVMKQVTFFRGMRVILINQVTRPAVGYIEFKDAGLVLQFEARGNNVLVK